MGNHVRVRPARVARRHRLYSIALVATAAIAWPGVASAYVGDSFLKIDGITGRWKSGDFKGWIHAEESEWPGRVKQLNSGGSDFLAGDKLFFGGPYAVRPGHSGRLIVTLDKTNPDVAPMMAICKAQKTVASMTYAESSDRVRPGAELGPRPAQFPAWWQYKLQDVALSDCPVVAGAVQQAFVLSFRDIKWLNYDPNQTDGTRIVVRPQDLPDVKPADATRQKVKSFLITWIAPATDAPEGSCPSMNAKPTEAQIFEYLSPEEVTQYKANATTGIPGASQTEYRGPHRLNVTTLPGIVRDPGLIEPDTKVAEGIDLDGDDGTGTPPKGVRKHGNFTSPDGRKGIDNQLLRVMACIKGYRGRRGYLNQTPNARRADGNITTIVEISGIDDEMNDNDVEIAFIHSQDKPVRDNGGKTFISNYSFRTTDDPNFALYNRRVHGRIVNGVVMTDVIPEFQFHPGQGAITNLYKAQMRFAPLPDGSMKGTLGGYVDWREMAGGGGYGEGLAGFQVPALYYALRREADGLKDPETGEYNGISVAYEIDTVPAFLVPAAPLHIAAAQTGKPLQ